MNACVFKRAVLKHIADAAETHHSGQKADVVVNCTGLASRTLGGVADDTVYPVRGQIMIVRNDPGSMTSISGSDDGGEEVSYIFPRAAGLCIHPTDCSSFKANDVQVAVLSSAELIRRTTGIHCLIRTLQTGLCSARSSLIRDS